MFKTVLTAAVATLAVVPAIASAEEARNFSHEGVDYTYSTEQKGKVTVIEGKSSGGAPFRLFVRGDRVTGTYNYRTVNFSRADVARDLTAAK